MPLQYKIEYRWDDKSPGFNKWKSHGRSHMSSSRSQPVSAADRVERASATGMGDRKDGGSSQQSVRDSLGKERAKSSASALEKVTLPAGYCVYYARGRGAPLLQTDPHQGRQGRSSNKGLGVVNPDSHNVVEEEYAIIREVMEIYLEKQTAEGSEGERYRVGGQLKQQEKLLDELMLSFSESEETTPTRSEPSPVQSDDLLPPTETTRKSMDTSRSLPTTRLSSRCLLPISRALRTDASPRGPFLMAGQSVRDARREICTRHIAPEDVSRESSDDSEALPEDHAQDCPDATTDPLEDPFQDKSQDPWREKASGDFSVPDSESLKHPRFDAKQKDQLSRENLGLFHALNYRDQRNPRFELIRRKTFLSSRPVHRFFPQRHEQLLVLSERSPIEHRTKDTARNSSRTARRTTPPRSKKDVSRTEKSPGGAFRGAVTGKAIDGTIQTWKSPSSYMRYNHNAHSGQPGKKSEVEGHSSVTRMPSKLVLDVVLPRENKSRNGRLDLTIGNLSLDRQVLQDWMSPRSSPPPPPPPSAPTNADEDDLEDMYILRQADGEGGSGEIPNSCCASFCSTASLSSPVEGAEEQELTDGHRPSSVTQQPSEASRHTSPTAPTPTTREAADPSRDSEQCLQSAQSSETTTPVQATGNSQDSADPPTPHAAVSESTAALPQQQQDDAHQAPTSSVRDLHCDVLGSGACADCQAAQHRQHFSAQQEILYPHISATPRHMVASHKMKDKRRIETDSPHAHSVSTASHVPDGQPNDVVTDLELCKRIVEKGHRARLPNSFPEVIASAQALSDKWMLNWVLISEFLIRNNLLSTTVFRKATGSDICPGL